MANPKKKATKTPAQQRAADFRRLAAWLDKRPNLKFGYTFNHRFYFNLSKDEVQEQIRTIGACKKVLMDPDMNFEVPFGDTITLVWHTRRENVCTRRVVGTRLVPEETIEAVEEHYVPEHEEDIVEWDCGSVLAPSTNLEEEEEK